MIVLFLMLLLPQDRTAATEKIAELVRQLGDDAQEKREAAMNDLMAVGAPALPLLKDAKASDDAEIRLRVAKLLKIIPLRARLAFSAELLKEYPNLYDDLAQCGTADEVCKILKKISLVKDGKPAYPASDDDIASLVRETMRDDREGLTSEEKVTIIGICGGQCECVQVGMSTMMRPGGLIVNVPIYESRRARAPVIDAIPELAKLAQDRDSDVRQEAMKIVNDIGLEKASPALRTMLADEDKETRKRAVAVLRGLGVSEGEIDRMTQETVEEKPKKE